MAHMSLPIHNPPSRAAAFVTIWVLFVDTTLLVPFSCSCPCCPILPVRPHAAAQPTSLFDPRSVSVERIVLVGRSLTFLYTLDTLPDLLAAAVVWPVCYLRFAALEDVCHVPNLPKIPAFFFCCCCWCCCCFWQCGQRFW